MDCPTCQELRRRGITEPIQAIEYQMIVNNFWSRAVVDALGHERAAVVAAWVNSEAGKAWQEKLG